MATILTANATGSNMHYGPFALAEGDGVNMEREQLFIAECGGLLSIVLTLNPFGDFFTHTKPCIPLKGLANQSLALHACSAVDCACSCVTTSMHPSAVMYTTQGNC